jgi:hypothetical protein
VSLLATEGDLDRAITALRVDFDRLAQAWQDDHHQRFRRVVAEPLEMHAGRMAALIQECDRSTRRLLAELARLSAG